MERGRRSKKEPLEEEMVHGSRTGFGLSSEAAVFPPCIASTRTRVLKNEGNHMMKYSVSPPEYDRAPSGATNKGVYRMMGTGEVASQGLIGHFAETTSICPVT
jgi:hypothetical protein